MNDEDDQGLMIVKEKANDGDNSDDMCDNIDGEG